MAVDLDWPLAPDADWLAQAACRTLDAELWWNKDLFGLARHICLTHCPVMAKCRAWSEQSPPWSECVVGGVAYVAHSNADYRRYVHQPEPSARLCGQCGEVS